MPLMSVKFLPSRKVAEIFFLCSISPSKDFLATDTALPTLVTFTLVTVVTALAFFV